MKNLKTIFLVLFLALLVFPLLQFRYHLVREIPLKGYYRQSELPSLKYFTWKRWFDSDFQDQFSIRLNDHAGFRKSLIRISNQYDYTLFNIIHAKGFIQGKKQFLYEEDYIHEYTGDYFIGRSAIDKKLSRLKNVMDTLNRYNIPLLLIFEPGKASFYPEYIPGRFNPGKRSTTNYDYMIQRANELGLPFLDMNRYFLQMKDTSRYPLFPRYGMHWSLYGVPIAVDTLARSVERATGRTLPKYATFRLIPTSIPIGTDNDIGELLNLACPLKSVSGAYPVVTYSPEIPRTLPALVIADSYYINIVESYGRHLFKSQDYWYYNKKLYPYQNNEPPVYVDKSNLRDKLKKYGVIMLMVSEINLHCGFWNFADEAFLAFHPEIKDPLIYGIENEIRNDREWFRFLVRKAKIQGSPLAEKIREDAEFTFYSNYNSLPGKSYWDTIYHLTLDIKNDAGWFAQVEKKARDFKISTDSMLLLDAIYSYDQSKKKP